MNTLSGWSDTIVALATPPGVGAIGVIRISGAESWKIADAMMPGKRLMEKSSHTVHFGLMAHDGQALDEVLVMLFKGPRSYTGEDTVEISGHGSPYVLERIIQACCALGARLAKPGEFTQRAFLNGKLDLTQAESVAEMIEAGTSAAHKTALQHLRGGFSKELQIIRDQLIQFASLIELELDFAMEDVEFANRAQFEQLLEASSEKVGRLLQSFQLGNVIRHGVTVALIGKPNAGKSTLLNALLNEERAIVSEQAGTTRDTIEEALNINGIQFRIIDTAGIRSHTEDRIEQAGIQRSMEKMRGADRVIYLFDVEQESVASVEDTLSKMREEGVSALIIPVANKVDQPGDWQKKFASLPNLLFASAMHQSGIDALKDVLYRSVVEQNIEEDQCLVTNARHVDALQKIQHSLRSISTALQENITGDLLAIEIRTCLHHLGEITGEVTTEDKLDYIFSKFCIGK